MEADLGVGVARSARLGRALGPQRARIAVAGVLVGYFALLDALGGHRQWSRLGVGNEWNWFGDLRNVTSAWDCVREGKAVLPTNPCDPYFQPANYPRLWLLPSHLGLGIGDTYTIGWTLICVFFVAALAVVPRGASLWQAALYALALCSPAVMLGVERGNVDIALFALVVLALLAARRSTLGLLVSDALLLLAAALKLFPVFAVGFLARRPSRRALLSLVAIVGCFALYAFAIRTQLHQIRAALPQEDKYSYGVRRVSDWVSAATEGARATAASLPGWDVLLLLAATTSAWFISRRLRRRPGWLGNDAGSQRDLDLFWAGACIYVGTYAIARSFDYRLAFCLLTVPQLYRFAAGGSKFAYLTILALLVTLWLDGLLFFSELKSWSNWTAVGPKGQTLPIAAISQLVLCLAFVSWLAATAPRLLHRRRAVALALPGALRPGSP